MLLPRERWEHSRPVREGPAQAHRRAWRLAVHVARDQTMRDKNAQSTAEVSEGNHDSVGIPIGFTQGFVSNCLVHSVYQHESGDRCRRENRVKQEAACQRIRLKKRVGLVDSSPPGLISLVLYLLLDGKFS